MRSFYEMSKEEIEKQSRRIYRKVDEIGIELKKVEKYCDNDDVTSKVYKRFYKATDQFEVVMGTLSGMHIMPFINENNGDDEYKQHYQLNNIDFIKLITRGREVHSQYISLLSKIE